MTDKIRVGIVGATVTQGGSHWGANAHVPALKALPNYELKAVCTSHEDTAKASAAAFGAERAFHRFSDMAAHPEVDLIVRSEERRVGKEWRGRRWRGECEEKQREA